MKLRVERNRLIGDTTLGKLFVNNKFFCYTLEDKVRNEKIYGKTAIPYGSYKVDITWSNHFKRRMPLIEHVEGFQGIRIHTGVDVDDTAGCLLIGKAVTKDNKLKFSKDTFNELFEKLEVAKAAGEKITIDIVAPDVKPIIISLGIGFALLMTSYILYKHALKKKIIK